MEKITWQRLETHQTVEGPRVLFTAQIPYRPGLFSSVFHEQLRELQYAGFTWKLPSIRVWTSQTGAQQIYYVFSRLNLQRGAVVLQTDISSSESSSVKEAIKLARVGCGAFALGEESVEKGYESWHNGKLIVVQGRLAPGATVFRHEDEQRAARLLTQYEAISDLNAADDLEEVKASRSPVLVQLTGRWELG